MVLDLSPGQTVLVAGHSYTVEEHSAFHEVDFRLDLVRLAGATPAHERWLIAALPEPYVMVAQRLEHEWLAPPRATVIQQGEIFINLYQGAAHRVRRGRSGRTKEGRVDYALFRANSGRVILTLAHDDELDAWIGLTAPQGTVMLPETSSSR